MPKAVINIQMYIIIIDVQQYSCGIIKSHNLMYRMGFPYFSTMV